jgi:murein DD-endopeptidase MepM/ murein hydrolase activator NlpD
MWLSLHSVILKPLFGLRNLSSGLNMLDSESDYGKGTGHMPLTKLRILTDRMTGKERRFRLRTLVALSSLPLFGVVAAFGLAPDTDTRNIAIRTVIEAVELPKIAAADSENHFQRDEQIHPGDTLASALARLKVDELDIQRLLASNVTGQNGVSLKAGQHIQAVTAANGQLLELHLANTGSNALHIRRQGDGFVSENTGEALETRVVMRSGRIASSLFAATDSAGVPDSVADQMADIFSTAIDFREDLRKGDTFSVVYTVNYRNGEPVATGKLLAAEFVNAGHAHRAVLFRNPFGREDYYTPDGESLKKGFLRSPLEFSRVTSSFSNSRKHPLYGFHRAHTGVDFGAPTGTRVKATGDAVVVFAARKGGYGNLAILRHQNGYETYYAHLNGFASGIRSGKPVGQGQVIGYVGTTGASTGPHLHYEVRIGGRPNNPMAIKLPGSAPLPVALKAAFRQQTAPWGGNLALLRGTNIAALD